VCDAVRNEYGARAHFTERASRGLDSGVHDYFTISSDHESDQRSLLRACSRVHVVLYRRVQAGGQIVIDRYSDRIVRVLPLSLVVSRGSRAPSGAPSGGPRRTMSFVASRTLRRVTSRHVSRAVPSRASHVIASYLADLRPVFSPVNPAVLIPPALPPSRSMSIAALRCPAAAAVVLLLHYYDYCYYYYCCYYYLNSSKCRLAYSY